MFTPDPNTDPPQESKNGAAEENSPYWGRLNLPDRYAGLDTKGRFFFWGCFLIAVNVIAWLFGYIFPRWMFVGVGLIIVSFLIPSDDSA